MAIKEQWKKIKENWLLLALLLVFLLLLSTCSQLLSAGSGSSYSYKNAIAPMMEMEDSDESYAVSRDSAGISYPGSGGFAPEAENRILTKTSRLSTEVERGTFNEKQAILKNAIQSSGAFLLNEDASNRGTERKSYYYGNYQIKVDAKRYDELISQLKGIGEVQSFNENQRDITGEYVNIQIEIETEKARLARYEEMYKEAQKVSDKIELNDRIFNQERTIKYMEDSLKKMDQRVDYSTIYFTMTEKRSDYADVMLVKLSKLVENLVSSFNALVALVFVLAPWAIAGLVIFFVVRLVRKKK